MKKVVLILAILLGILHQDFWNWNNANLVFGFMPVGLAYHACYSLAAAALWAFAIKFAWPNEIVAWADIEDYGEGESK
jgi:hypothetical protein